MKVLFVCNQNKNRSKTAAELFRGRFETKSAGLYSESPITEEDILWADIIIVMEDEHRCEIAKRFPKQYMKKHILSLGIPDMFKYNDPELIRLLSSKIHDLL